MISWRSHASLVSTTLIDEVPVVFCHLRYYYHDSDYFFTAEQKKEISPKKRGSRTRTTDDLSNGTTAQPFILMFLHANFIRLTFIYTYIRTGKLIFRPEKQKEHPSQREDASTTDIDPGRVGKVVQGEARPGTIDRSGPQLELFRRRLKTWSKSEPPVALVQAPKYLYMHPICNLFVVRKCRGHGIVRRVTLSFYLEHFWGQV